jgi:MoaA/NifB/PqqE/SkfB family radical SAM enzyme
VLDFETLEAVWQSPKAQEIQADIQDKKFTWCAVEHCGIIRHHIELDRATLAINVDDSCNLSCASCRREKIMVDSGPDFERRQQALRHILGWLEKYNEPINITLGGNGDPLASSVIRPLFHEYVPKANQLFVLHTNGLLLRKQLANSALLPQVGAVLLSVDAGTANTYEKIRRGGSWPVLINNLEFLREAGLNRSTTLKFCLQAGNWHELEQFVDLCQHYGFTAHIHQLDDWGTWSNIMPAYPDAWTLRNGTFIDHNVLDPDHKDHARCVQVLRRLHCDYKPPQVFIDGYLLGKLNEST